MLLWEAVGFLVSLQKSHSSHTADTDTKIHHKEDGGLADFKGQIVLTLSEDSCPAANHDTLRASTAQRLQSYTV